MIWGGETNILSRYRVIGKVEKERIAKGKVYICDRHYAEEDIECTGKSELPSSFCLGKVNTTSKEQSYCSLKLIYARL